MAAGLTSLIGALLAQTMIPRQADTTSLRLSVYALRFGVPALVMLAGTLSLRRNRPLAVGLLASVGLGVVLPVAYVFLTVLATGDLMP